MTEQTINFFSNKLVKVNSVKRMVQYGIWPNCPNSCDFCLIKEKDFYDKTKQIYWIRAIKENIKRINWSSFPYGISLLGGEIYYIKDRDVQLEYLALIDTIIEYVLTDENKSARYSTVTNGLYEPSFLYEVIDKIISKTDLSRIDLNFSYDLKYRFKNEAAKKRVLKNIIAARDKYNYAVGVQMILTQNLINLWKAKQFDINEFLAKEIPGCNFAFLYPHKIQTGIALNDFFFKRSDFIQFLSYLKNANYEVYSNFINSAKNSAIFKYTGLQSHKRNDAKTLAEQPILSDDKDIIADCGHSILYRCYADSNKCMLCDIENIDGDL